MAEQTAQQVKSALKSKLIYFDPGYIVEGESPTTVPPRFVQIIGGPQGTREISAAEAAKAIGLSASDLTKFGPAIGMGLNESTPFLQQYVTPQRSGGFFSSLLGMGLGTVGSVVGGLTDAAANPIASTLGVHPDVVKAAAAAAGMYYLGGTTFVDVATGAVVPEAAATDLIASSLGAESLAVPAVGAATAPAAAATAFPVAAAPLTAPSVLAGDTLGASLAGLTPEQIAAATSANTLVPATATAAGANALTGTAALSPEALAAHDAAVGLTAGGGVPAAATGATATGLGGYGGAGDVLNPLTGTIIPGTDAAALTGAGAGALGAAGAGAAGAAGANALGSSALVPLALAGTGILGALTARSAAETQADAARYAADQAYKIYQEQKALQEPFRTAGITAQNQLLTLLGLQGGTPGAEFGKYARPFGMQDFQADPGYAFRLSEGLKALEASRAAKGGLLSGATGKALSRYGQDLASQEYSNAFNRYQTERANRLAPLGSLMGTGQAAASGMAGSAGQYGTNLSNLTTSGAAAQAAGQVGMANALTGSLNTYLNYAANQNLVNALQESATRRASMYNPVIPG